jgi:hypothetical protein
MGGLVFTGISLRREERTREVSNLLTIKQQYSDMWEQLYERPALFRVLEREVDLHTMPVTEEEKLFIKLLIGHLDAVRRMSKAGQFFEIGALRKDIHDFISLPIPATVWEKIKAFQDDGLIELVEGPCD